VSSIDSDILDLSEVSIPQAPPGYKSGFIGIIGRPNVGKSTLMNELVGQIAITSPAQTTRNRLRGILTTPSAQLILSIRQEFINRTTSWGSCWCKMPKLLDSVDVVLFVVDGSVEGRRSLHC